MPLYYIISLQEILGCVVHVCAAKYPIYTNMIQGEFLQHLNLCTTTLHSHFAGCLWSLKLLVEVIHLLQLMLIQQLNKNHCINLNRLGERRSSEPWKWHSLLASRKEQASFQIPRSSTWPRGWASRPVDHYHVAPAGRPAAHAASSIHVVTS